LTQIILDLDGLIVNFHDAALKLHGVHDSVEVFYQNNLGEYWIPDILGIPRIHFFVRMDYNFWRDLDWTSEGPALVEALELRFGQSNIALWSAPCDTPGCCDGKRDWVRYHMHPHYFRHLILGSVKHLAANPSTILIDDYEENVDPFIKKGHGILFPRIWNRNHHLRHVSLEHTYSELDRIQRDHRDHPHERTYNVTRATTEKLS
jgi:5'(3')-deoxyribonucleotidase